MSQSTSGEHQELVERFEAEVSEHIADHAAPSAEHTVSNTRAAGEQSYYLVGLANIGDFTYSVRIAYRTSDHPSETQVIDVTHPAGTQINFRLTDPGQCASLVAYLIRCYRDGQLDVRIPTQGVFTPERIRQEFPEDTDPCSDLWAYQ